MTVGLIFVSAAVYLFDVLLDRTLTAWGAKSALIWHGEYHRLLTATFLHADLPHLAMNMLALWIFGQAVERVTGGRRFLVLYLVSGGIGYLASLLWAPYNVAVGASAAIFGLMGYALHFRVRRGERRWLPLDGVLLQILVLNLLIGWIVPNIDHVAHAGGFAGGILCGSLLGLGAGRQARHQSRREAALAALLLALVVAGGLRPLHAADVLGRVWPELAQEMQDRYAAVFHLPYWPMGKSVYWLYADRVFGGGQERVESGELAVDAERPVQLSVYWRWDPPPYVLGPREEYAPGEPMAYRVEWLQDGALVHTTEGVVAEIDPDPRYVYQRSVLPARRGGELAGNWTIRIVGDQGTVSELELHVTATQTE